MKCLESNHTKNSPRVLTTYRNNFTLEEKANKRGMISALFT